MTRIFLLLLALSIAACKNPCRDVQCFNGECTDGTCNCLFGYEGVACDHMLNEKFAGDFQVQEECNGNADTYSCSVVADTASPDRIIFTNLFQTYAEAYGRIASNGTDFTLEGNLLAATLSGSGTLSSDGNQITLVYTLVLGPNTWNCSATFERQ